MSETKIEFTDAESLARFVAVIVKQGLTFYVVPDFRYLKSEHFDKWTVYLTGGF